MTRLRSPSLTLLLLVAACASPHAVDAPQPVAPIPRFAKDDPRVATAGFVAQTLRLHREVGEVRYTLMAFVVGDRLTLGAMVRGAFEGQVHFTVGEHQLDFPFDSAHPPAELDIKVDDGRGVMEKGQGASFRGTAWVNVELPVADWLRPGAPLSLEFTATGGHSVHLPADAPAYNAEFTDA